MASSASSELLLSFISTAVQLMRRYTSLRPSPLLLLMKARWQQKAAHPSPGVYGDIPKAREVKAQIPYQPSPPYACGASDCSAEQFTQI